MDAQREAIARAALEVLLEKGVYKTSLRDICKAAGISIGALYTHFKTTEEAIVAACALDHVEREAAPPAETWDEYVGGFNIGFQKGGRDSRRFRLSLQFVAELTQMDHNPPGLSAIYHLYRESIAKSLRRLHQLGEISLPLGLEMTVELHMQLGAGSEYQLASDRDLASDGVLQALRTGLALTAGRMNGSEDAEHSAPPDRSVAAASTPPKPAMAKSQ
ncbi:TetR/AcrR family transcriptional regulator [uncultured Caulobacter sp.]|uniref:TetR/AcrR family transcriptional regulator n=1 Tax=uncultured Caulobacter sp. TaxID=158749 RepID=UPI00260203B0|nr:TetR/AcrR family transcriptional regulator [uncultured Caulobacter sp.]